MFYSPITHLSIFCSYSIFIGFCFCILSADYLCVRLSFFECFLSSSWSKCWGADWSGFLAGEAGCSCGFGIGWESIGIEYLICSFYHYGLKNYLFISIESQCIHRSHPNPHKQLLHTLSWILHCQNLEYMLGTLTTFVHKLKIVLESYWHHLHCSDFLLATYLRDVKENF